MRTSLLLATILFSSLCINTAYAQTINIKADSVYSFADIDVPPTPIKGMPFLYKEWSAKVKYPKQAKRLGIEGKVFITFIVDKDGSLGNPLIIRGIGAGCDAATIEAFKEMKLVWFAGKHNGEAVKTKMVLPFVFKLN